MSRHSPEERVDYILNGLREGASHAHKILDLECAKDKPNAESILAATLTRTVYTSALSIVEVVLCTQKIVLEELARLLDERLGPPPVGTA